MEPAQRRDDRLTIAAHDDDELALVRRRLLQQAFVFEDPAVYAAGVEDALNAVRELQQRRGPTEAARANAAVDDRPILIRGAAG